MQAWSNYIRKIPLFGEIYARNYFTWKRAYVNFLRKSGIQPGPVVVHWLCTYRCNSSCVYCEASANQVSCDELSTARIKKVLDDLAAIKTRHLFVTGGEPMTRNDLFDVLRYAKQCGMSVGMITNSLLYEKFKKELRGVGFKTLWTSVDGLEETHNRNRGVAGAYQTTLNAIRYYAELNIPVRVVNTMVHPGNIDELPQLFKELREAGITRWRLALAIPVGRGDDDHEQWVLPPEKIEEVFRYVAEARKEFDVELSEELGYLGCWDSRTKNEPFLCPSGLTQCVIMPDGHVLPCQTVYDTKFSQGNVQSTSIKEIWRHGFGEFRNVELKGECAECLHRKACSGGCWGRKVTAGTCLRAIWDPENYGDQRTGNVR